MSQIFFTSSLFCWATPSMSCRRRFFFYLRGEVYTYFQVGVRVYCIRVSRQILTAQAKDICKIANRSIRFSGNGCKIFIRKWAWTSLLIPKRTSAITPPTATMSVSCTSWVRVPNTASLLVVGALQICLDWLQRRRLHGARGNVPPLLQMAGHGGTVSRRTASKKLTKLYWPSRKRSPK